MAQLTTTSTNGHDIRVPKTAELVATHIRKQIVRGDIREDDSLPPENALIEEFSISRPTLREAFRILESEGLISIRRGAHGGARVLVPSAEMAAGYAGSVLQHRGATLADVMNTRVLVEAPAARLVAERKDRKKCADELQRLLTEVRPPERFSDFNARLVELTRSETLVLIVTMLESVMRAAAMRFVQTPHRDNDMKLLRESERARHRVIELIRHGEADAAEALWRHHLTAQARVLGGTLSGRVIELFD